MSGVQVIRVRGARRRRRRLRRVVRRGVIGAGVLVVLGVLAVGWVTVRGLQARAHLHRADAAIAALDRDAVGSSAGAVASDAATIQVEAAAAHHDTDDPVWRAVGAVPILGDPVRAVAGLTRATDAVAEQSLPTLIRLEEQVGTARLRLGSGTVDLTALRAGAPALGAADASLRTQLGVVAALPSRTYLTAVNGEVAQGLGRLRALQQQVADAAATARLGPGLLGADGPRTYFVAFQNNAEARGTGGIVGAYGLLRADRGHLSFSRLGSDADLRGGLPPVPVAAGVQQRFGASGVSSVWQNANLSPSFPDAARTYLALWREQTGQQLDGAIAVDPVTLSYLLAATGPVRLPNGDLVTSQSVVAQTESTVYARFAGTTQRKDYLQDVSRATTHAVLTAPAAEAPKIVTALTVAVLEHRLMLYTTDTAVQAQLADYSVAGALPSPAQPTAILAVDNATGSKLDYYLSSHLAVTEGTCTAGMRSVTAQITLTNGAPPSGLPAYVLQHGPDLPTTPGTSVLLVSYYASAGAQVLSASADGTAVGVNASADSGLAVFGMSVVLPPGATRHMTLHLVEPARSLPVQTRPQPLVRTQTVSLDQSSCV